MRDQRLDDVLPAAQAGQPWALRVLYDELAPRVHGYLRSRGAAEAEDLTSEVFLAVFPRLGTVTGGAAGLRTLVFSVAHARLVDELRRRSRREPTVEFDAHRHDGVAPSSETRPSRPSRPTRSGRCSPASPTTSGTSCSCGWSPI